MGLTFLQDFLTSSPAQFSPLFGYEKHLHKPADAVDFACGFTLEQLSPLKSIVSAPLRSIIDKLLENKLWREHLFQFWLEYDGSSVQSFPGFFLGVRNGASHISFVIQQILPYIYDGAFLLAVQKTIGRWLELFPQSAWFNYIGYFPSRSSDYVRLTVQFPKSFSPLDCWRYVFSEDHPSGLADFSETLSGSYDFVVVHLDIGSNIRPRMGFELRFDEGELDLSNQERWRPVLAYLEKQGYISSDKVDALLSEKGVKRIIDNENFVPRWYTFNLYYIKAIFEKSECPQFKAYFAFKPLNKGLWRNEKAITSSRLDPGQAGQARLSS